MTIRTLYSWDIPDVIPLLVLFNAEAGDIYPFDARGTEIFLRQIYAQQSGTIIAAYLDNELVGVLGAVITFYPGTDVKRANELFFFILPERRGGSTAARMVKAYEKWAFNEKGAVSAQAVSLKVTDPDGKVSGFYEALGYAEVETCHVKKRP